ncbi:hypothetical protein [Terricaulis silvestris]|uniref:Uncharacterized protein n=1 Tax=Terricaulis silvestris TaxID=2686094 RepID=A0A6I6MJD6_9CAUL|nr:hypothetical protein [Terricaulis silvestris]QGZ93981.1 hypothetical protein DSM104635_00797 [Terricaulis silvestris]
MTERICVVGVVIPMAGAEYIKLSDRRSLSDFDVVIFSPTFGIHSAATYEGLPSLAHNNAATLHSHYTHWKSEIETAAKQGKTVIILACKPEAYFYQTGEKQYSGTGKNARVTNIVAPASNYALLKDLPLTPLALEGKQLKQTPEASRFASLCKMFAEREYYESIFPKAGNPLLVLPDGSGRAAALVSRQFPSVLVFPMINQEGGWVQSKLDKSGATQASWTKIAIQLGERFKSAVLEAHANIKAGVGETKPEWVLADKYRSNVQRARDAELEKLRLQRDKIDADIARGVQDNAVEDQWLGLLFGTGAALEDQVREALRLLGYDAAEYQDDTHQFDVVFSFEGARYLGECEGKDNKAIDIAKLSQLERCVAEDLAIRGGEEFADGVLFGNPFRLHPLESRTGAPFTERVMKAAAQRGTRLVLTSDLFACVLAIRNGAGEDFKKSCRDAIATDRGKVITFPK